MHIYISTYIHIYVYMYIYIYIGSDVIYVCECMYMIPFESIIIHLNVCRTIRCSHAYIFIYIDIYVYIYICIRLHVYIYTHSHVYIYECVQNDFEGLNSTCS